MLNKIRAWFGLCVHEYHWEAVGTCHFDNGTTKPLKVYCCKHCGDGKVEWMKTWRHF